MMIDLVKVRREAMRWYIILTLHNARPSGCYEELILSTIIALYEDVTGLEIRREVEYLEERQLVHLQREPSGRWFCKLTRIGIDIAEYTIDVEPGIARPPKVWG